MQYGMIGYYVPHSVYAPGYHCDPRMPVPFAALASQKNYLSIYLMCVYLDEGHQTWFREAWARTGKKLDMGKSCVRVKKIEDVPLEVIGQAIKRVPVRKFIEHYESTLGEASARKARSSRTKKAATKKTAGAATPAQKKAASTAPAKRSSAARRKKT